jgi:hypothetical protein
MKAQNGFEFGLSSRRTLTLVVTLPSVPSKGKRIWQINLTVCLVARKIGADHSEITAHVSLFVMDYSATKPIFKNSLPVFSIWNCISLSCCIEFGCPLYSS